MKKIILLSLLFMSLAPTSGCIVQSSQLNSLKELLKSPDIKVVGSRWSLSYSGYQSVVYAVSTREGILFSNNLSDQVLFDGWTLRTIKGMGRRLNVSITDKKNIRIFKRGDRAISNHHCDQWRQRENQGIVRFSQRCSGKKGYENSILVEENGDISLIRQIVDERYTALTLTKLK